MFLLIVYNVNDLDVGDILMYSLLVGDYLIKFGIDFGMG